MTTLSDRMAALRGPNRAMEWDIAVAAGVRSADEKPYVWAGVDQMQFVKGVPRYLSSIDAALTLMPDGCYPQFSKVSENEWHVHLGFANRAVGIVAKAPTLAIAICVVALRERGL